MRVDGIGVERDSCAVFEDGLIGLAITEVGIAGVVVNHGCYDRLSGIEQRHRRFIQELIGMIRVSALFVCKDHTMVGPQHQPKMPVDDGELTRKWSIDDQTQRRSESTSRMVERGSKARHDVVEGPIAT
jgi:hypothetical protein